MAALAVVAAVVARRPALLGIAAFAMASVLAGRALAGLAPPSPAPFAGRATLVSDPSPSGYGVRADVRIGHRRLELVASRGGAGALSAAAAGEVVRVRGTVRPPPPGAGWLVPRHVSGRLLASHVERVGEGAAPWRAANRLRRILVRGAAVLPDPERALFGGFVLGDERGEPPEVVDDFRGAGLTHVLVVSGQNVAFVLLLVRPALQRLAWPGRWLLTLAVVGAFGLLTRFEPSVLRAAAMVAVSITAGAAGRPTRPLRTLALAVGGLLLVDPLLAWSVGFQLSVGASLGLALWSAPLAELLPGPAPLREALAVTVAAQAGVAPVLVPRFGGLPVVALAANVVAVPVAGLVTSWGLPAGLVAGLAGPSVARVVHLPTRLMIGWVATVARVAASLPLGEVDARGLVVLAAALAFLAAGRRRLATRSGPVPAAAAAAVAWAAVAVALVGPAVHLRSPPPLARVPGGEVHRGGGATVVVVGGGGASMGATAAEDLLAGLRRTGLRRVDLLVADGRRLAALRSLVAHRWPVGAVLAADASPPRRVRVGPLVVSVARGRDPTVATDMVRP
jgi:competence protein ComEC